MPKHEDSSSETSEESRRQASRRTARPQGSAGQKGASQTSAVMSGGATDADIRRNNDRDISDYKKDKCGVTHEPVGTKPDYRTPKSKIDWRAGREPSGSPKIEGSTNDKDYFGGRKPPQRSSISREGHPGNGGKGKGKGKGKA